ncbi:MAG: hypothetical protein ACLTYN_02285 [Dysosmobacter welbionis]
MLLTLYDLLRSGMWAALFTLPQLLAVWLVLWCSSGTGSGTFCGSSALPSAIRTPTDHPVQVRSEAAAEEGPAAGLPPHCEVCGH